MRSMRYSIGLLMALLSLSANAAVYLEEHFEKGIPSSWQQQSLGEMPSMWIADTTQSFPTSSGARIAFRNASSSTKNMRSRLILPATDLRGVVSPQLILTHAQVGRSQVNTDTLRIYYRSAATLPWRLLCTYDKAISTLRTDTLALLETNTASYQLCLEGADNIGRGIVIDELIIRSESTCATALSLSVLPRTDGAKISWEDISSRYFDLYVTRVAGDPTKMAKSDIVYHGEHIQDLYANVSGLSTLTTYYVYLRTECADDPSGFTPFISTSFHTSIPFPYQEDFDSSNQLPAGWQVLSGTVEDAYAGYMPEINRSATFGWRLTEAPLLTGSNHMLCYFSSNTAPCWLIMPSIDLSSLSATEVGLRFRLSMTAAAGDKIEVTNKDNYRFYVLISEDGGHSWTVENKVEWSAREQADYRTRDLNVDPSTFNINLSRYAGSVVQIAFVSEAVYGSAYYHLDHVVLDKADAMCGGVSRLSLRPEVVTATATWQVDGKQPSIIELSESEKFFPVLLSDTLNGTSYTFKNLHPHTNYYVRVRQDCSESTWIRQSMLTLDGVPYFEGFDLMTMPDGWVRYRGSSSDFFQGRVQKSSKGFEIRARSDGLPANHLTCEIYEGDYWAVTPLIKTNMVDKNAAIRLTFHMALTTWTTSGKAHDANYTDRIWVVISGDGGKTWKQTDATLWSSNESDNKDYEYNAIPRTGGLYKVDLTSFIGKDIRIAFGVETPVDMITNNRIHIGDIRIEEYDRRCQGVESLSVTPMPGQAELTWVPKGGGDPAVSIEIATSDDFLGPHIVRRLTASQSPYVVTGLAEKTTYYVRVRQQCTDSEEEWVVRSFETSMALPFIEHFEQSRLPEGWVHYAGDYFADEAFETPAVAQSGYWIVMTDPNCPMEGVHLHVNTYGNCKFGVATPNIYLPKNDPRSVEYTLRLAASGHESPYATKALSGGTLALLISANGGPWKTLDAWGARGMNSQLIKDIDENGEDLKYDLSAYKGQAIRLCFYSHSTNDGANYDIHIDDVRVRMLDPNCQGLTAVSVTATTATTATIRCAMTGTQSALLQLYNGEELVSEDTTTTAVYNFRNLSSNTIYTLRARQVCDVDGEWIETTIRTLCDKVTPEEFGVETFTDELNFDCWRTGFIDEGNTDNAYAERVLDDTHGYFLHLGRSVGKGADGAYALSPELNVSDTINKLTLRFRAGTTLQDPINIAQLIVGIVSDPVAMTFTALDTISLSYAAAVENEKDYAISFDKYDGDYMGRMGHYIMFLSMAGSGNANDILIDDVYFGTERKEADPVGECDGVSGLRATGSDNTITATWYSSTGNYEAVICTRNSPRAAVDTIRTTAREAVFRNLEYSSTYYVFVRSICPDGKSVSAWSLSAVAMTALGIPYSENFNSATSKTVPSGAWTGYRGSGILTTQDFRPTTVNRDTTGWYYNDPRKVNGITGVALRAEIFTNAYNAMVTSPEIMLNPRGATDGAELSFKVAAAAHGIGALGQSKTHSFAVYISTDNGTSYQRIGYWASNGLGDYDYNMISSDAGIYRLDLTDYLGKRVRIGFMTNGGSDFAPDTDFWLDDISIHYSQLPPCRIPSKPTYEAGATDVSLSWSGATAEYDVVVMEADSAIVDSLIQRVSGKSAVIRGLTPGMNYAAYVRAVCDEDNLSEWSTPARFMTSCLVTIPVKYDFDNVNTWWTTNKTYGLFSEGCWTTSLGSPSISLNYVTLQRSNEMSAEESEDGHIYSHSGNNALYLVSKGSNAAGYAALPAVDLPLDTLQVTFYARPGYCYVPKTGGVPGMTNCSSPVTLQVGTMTIPEDPSTFRALQSMTLSVPYNAETMEPTPLDTDPEGTDYWRRFKVSLAGATGRYICFAVVGGKGEKYLSIDDVEVSIYSDCDLPMSPTVTPGVNTADIAWTPGETDAESYEVLVYNNEGDTLRYTPSEPKLKATGLAPMTIYHVMLRGICSPTDRSEWTEPITFMTDCDSYAIPWMEGFEIARPTEHTAPLCWKIQDANRSGYPLAYNGHSSEEEVQDYIYSGKGALYMSATDVEHAAYAMLPDFDASLSALSLSFYYRLTGSGTLELGYLTDATDAATYTRLQSWPASSAWQSIQYKLRDIPAAAAMSARLAFRLIPDGDCVLGVDDIILAETEACQTPENVRVSGASLDTAYVEWDGSLRANYTLELSRDADFRTREQTLSVKAANHASLSGLSAATRYYIRVRRICDVDDESAWSETAHLLTAITLRDTVCYGYNYSDDKGRFVSLPADRMMPGENHYISHVAARAAGAPDSTFYLTLHMDTVAITSYHRTLCEGEDYADENFHLTNVQLGATRQQRFYDGAEHCDSLVVMYLTVHSMQRTAIHDTINEGDTYPWAGQLLTEQGTYVDTVSTVTGCDSIITLYLHFYANPEQELTVRLCYGETYFFDGQYLNETGTYVEHVLTEQGIDSITTLHLTALPEYRDYRRVAICHGQYYSDSTFVELSRSGFYTITIPSIDGCDSVVSRNLLVADVDFNIVDSIGLNQLPYVVNGEEILPVGTEMGTYESALALECGDVMLTIYVGEHREEGWLDIYQKSGRARKIIIDGILYIEIDGELWNVYGAKMK